MIIHRGILKGNLGGVVQTRNMFVFDVSPDSRDDIADVMQAAILTVITPLQGLLSNTFTWSSLECQVQMEDGRFSTYQENSCEVPGLVSGDQVANFVAAVLIAKAPGIRAIGRKFFSGLCEGAVNGNSLVAAAMVSAATALTHYITPYTSANGSILTPGIVKKDGSFSPFVGGFVSSLLGTCRRRKPGLGI